ncbi:hypothetical protein [Thomasclavelia cocleata]|jgi:hypothetical protein|uniref:hypothetical protein n=1 Tax=Thomasclavelia cocleata TaxID=69824 RepID=UPI00258FBD65|nr:hypothetical protein [Thomasclavelia cocleata]MCI8751442.1 hypothetical protein [Lachnospiraceae bacterium]
MSDIKEVINCPKCNQKLRIPVGKRLEIHCPTCGNNFIKENELSSIKSSDKTEMKEIKYPLLVNSDENKILLQKKDKCDKFDYIAAVACGAIGGIIDIFLVGSPGDSILGKWTDEQVNNVVIRFAEKLGWCPREKNIRNAIGFLERKKKVNYDQRTSNDVNNLFKITPKNHHMMSLAHSPDIVGLFFSVLNQFTSTSSFIANGQLVTIATDTYELQGGNFIMKIMCGISNWVWHIMSDIAGSSNSSANGKRGMGIVIPFYEFFGFCKFGSFMTENRRKDFSEIAMQAYTKGYDFRFGIGQAIPLIVTELSIKLIWALKQRFQYHAPLMKCIPTNKMDSVRVMLLIGNGTLCVMDGIDAGIRSGGNFLNFFMRLNIFAWFRLATSVLKEVFIRVGIAVPLQMDIAAYKRINEALQIYLHELEMIDIKLFKEETEKYNEIINIFVIAKTDEELNVMLLNMYDKLDLDKPWKGDFNEFMSNKNETLVFK